MHAQICTPICALHAGAYIYIYIQTETARGVGDIYSAK